MIIHLLSEENTRRLCGALAARLSDDPTRQAALTRVMVEDTWIRVADLPLRVTSPLIIHDSDWHRMEQANRQRYAMMNDLKLNGMRVYVARRATGSYWSMYGSCTHTPPLSLSDDHVLWLSPVDARRLADCVVSAYDGFMQRVRAQWEQACRD